jgi:hypothetical protein
MRDTTERSIMRKTEEESMGARGDKNETLTSNPHSQRHENSYINPPVTAIYA